MPPACRLAILSNELDLFYGAALRQRMAALRDVELIVDATYTGILKPDPRAYALCTQQLGVAPGECVFVDDQPRNVDGAVAVGMAAVWFDVTQPQRVLRRGAAPARPAAADSGHRGHKLRHASVLVASSGAALRAAAQSATDALRFAPRGRHRPASTRCMTTLPLRRRSALAAGRAGRDAALKLATLGLARLDCWLLAPLIAAMAWPLWAYRREQLMFVRRLLLAGATTESGRVRRWFWRGTVVQSLGVVHRAAVGRGDAPDGGAADSCCNGASSPPTRGCWPRWRRRCGSCCATRSRRPSSAPSRAAGRCCWATRCCCSSPSSPTTTRLGFADTRALSWNALVAQTMQSAQADAACPTAGTLLGVAALADQLPRHAAMLLLPDLADSRVRLLAWLVLLACHRLRRPTCSRATCSACRPCSTGAR